MKRRVRADYQKRNAEPPAYIIRPLRRFDLEGWSRFNRWLVLPPTHPNKADAFFFNQREREPGDGEL